MPGIQWHMGDPQLVNTQRWRTERDMNTYSGMGALGALMLRRWNKHLQDEAALDAETIKTEEMLGTAAARAMPKEDEGQGGAGGPAPESVGSNQAATGDKLVEGEQDPPVEGEDAPAIGTATEEVEKPGALSRFATTGLEMLKRFPQNVTGTIGLTDFPGMEERRAKLAKLQGQQQRQVFRAKALAPAYSTAALYENPTEFLNAVSKGTQFPELIPRRKGMFEGGSGINMWKLQAMVQEYPPGSPQHEWAQRMLDADMERQREIFGGKQRMGDENALDRGVGPGITPSDQAMNSEIVAWIAGEAGLTSEQQRQVLAQANELISPRLRQAFRMWNEGKDDPEALDKAISGEGGSIISAISAKAKLPDIKNPAVQTEMGLGWLNEFVRSKGIPGVRPGGVPSGSPDEWKRVYEPPADSSVSPQEDSTYPPGTRFDRKRRLAMTPDGDVYDMDSRVLFGEKRP